jgi:hypothetical protein
MFYSAVLFPGILIGGVVIAVRARRRLALVGLLGVSILVCSWIFKSELRYRVPFDVAFLPTAVIGWSWVMARLPWRAKRRGGAVAKVGVESSSGEAAREEREPEGVAAQ